MANQVRPVQNRQLLILTCFVIVASVIHGLKFSPVKALVTVFIHLPNHVLNLGLQDTI